MSYLAVTVGGIGLFLWGMWLITDGLRQAAGPALDKIFTSWTSTRLKGLLAGTLLTAAVQSSSVVTMAIIGFANAGIISFQRAVWMMFGSNPGTTVTAWIVALVGFKFKIDLLALPIIGAGAMLRLVGFSERYKSLGVALTGFGLLLLGIEVLSTGLGELSNEVSFEQEHNLLVMVFIGIILASIIMSSAAPVALVLTALAAGNINMVDAAAVVIGANMGTSFKSLLVMPGATSNGKRLAAAHVFFNVFTGIVFTLFITPLLGLMYWLGSLVGAGDNPVILMAIFHTIFNVGGVILMWPIEPYMSRFLIARFRDPEREKVSLQFLDESVITVPSTISTALKQEYAKLLEATPEVLAQLPYRVAPAEQWRTEDEARERKIAAIGEFLTQAGRSQVPDDISQDLALGWNIYHNLSLIETDIGQLRNLVGEWPQGSQNEQATALLTQWLKQLAAHLEHVWLHKENASLAIWQEAYVITKNQLLRKGLSGAMSREALDVALQSCSVSRRMAEQWLRTYVVWMQLANGEQEEAEIESSAG